MRDLNRYVILATASPESTSEFVASFVKGSPEPLGLELEAIKCTRRYGSPYSLDPIDYENLTPVENGNVEVTYRPKEYSYINFENECDEPEIQSKLMVLGGALAIVGSLDLPDDDPFAIRVQNGFTTRLVDGFNLRRMATTKTIKAGPNYIFFG